MDAEKQALERAVREAAVKAEYDRNNANQLRDEISKLKSKMEENRYVYKVLYFIFLLIILKVYMHI